MKKLLLLLPLLAGCATGDYQRYAEIQIAQAKAEESRYASMAKIAESGDTATKVAAMFAMSKAEAGGRAIVAAPKSGWDIARDMLGIILPVAVQGYGIHANQIISTTASNNATALGVSTNNAFVGIASQIQAPAANVTTTLSGSGVIGSGAYSTTQTTDSHAISGSYNPIDNSNQGNPVTYPVMP